MSRMKILKYFIANGCIICSLALLIIFILDWYNPFMDFLGHAKILLYLLCMCSIYMGISNLREREEHGITYKKNRR